MVILAVEAGNVRAELEVLTRGVVVFALVHAQGEQFQLGVVADDVGVGGGAGVAGLVVGGPERSDVDGILCGHLESAAADGGVVNGVVAGGDEAHGNISGIAECQRLALAAVDGLAALEGGGADGGKAAGAVGGFVADEGNILAQGDGAGAAGAVAVAAVHAAEVDGGVVVVGEDALVVFVVADDGALV